MTKEQLNQVYIVALNRNNELFYYKQANYLTALLENGYREPKLIKVVTNENDPMNRVCPPFLERSAMKCRFIRKWRTKDLGTLQVIQEGEDFYVHSSIKGTLSSSKGSTADEVQANLNKLGVLKRLQQLSAENVEF